MMTNLGQPLLSVLEFTSWSMLGWLAAGILPWLIHRWHRRHHHKTSWAAVELLLAAIEHRARRIRFQQWFLLAVRTAILLMVALAAAEPVWRQWALGAGDGTPVHRVLVVDQSYSMSCRHQGVSRFERAKIHGRRLMEEADAVTILAWGADAENVIGRPALDTSRALSVWEDLETAYVRADLETALHGVAAALDRAEQDAPHLSRHQVFFLTDLGRNTWTAEQAARTRISALAERASLTLLHVGDEQRENVAVAKLSVEPAAVLRGREVVLAATVRNYGQTSKKGLKVQLTGNGRLWDTQTVDLPAGGTEVVNFAHQFVEEGRYTIEAALAAPADCLPVDDRRWLAIDVRPQLRVACVASRPGAADEVARALSFAQGAIVPEVFPLGHLATLDLATYDALFLAGGAQL
ncbi:MAG: BatA domain-containing protein, partial [Pirellulales bacterium]|nr:BatA domain-containing protein [Pirellulales bacterium]